MHFCPFSRNHLQHQLLSRHWRINLVPYTQIPQGFWKDLIEKVIWRPRSRHTTPVISSRRILPSKIYLFAVSQCWKRCRHSSSLEEPPFGSKKHHDLCTMPLLVWLIIATSLSSICGKNINKLKYLVLVTIIKIWKIRWPPLMELTQSLYCIFFSDS